MYNKNVLTNLSCLIQSLNAHFSHSNAHETLSEFSGDWPRITVVTPNYNGAETLPRTIESIIQQDYPNLQYIIVDGGSTDDSHGIIEEYSPFITEVVNGHDRTMYDAVAKGFDRATGEILAWLNSDDFYEPGILRKVGALFAKYPDWKVIYFDDNVWKQGWRVANRLQKYVGLPELLKGHVIYQASTFFRRDAYEAVGGVERDTLRLAGDYQLWVRLASRFTLHLVSGHGSTFCIRKNQLSGDWESYLKEMAAVRNGALAHLPRFFWLWTLPEVFLRRLASERRVRSQRFLYELRNENRNWPTVEEAQPGPISTCRCPVCRMHPERLLFSTPDTHFGDRTVRMVYYCPLCELAFVYPKPAKKDLAELNERASALRYPAAAHSDHETYSPYRVRSRLAAPWGFWFDILKLVGRFITGGSPVPLDRGIWSQARPRFNEPKHAAMMTFGRRGGGVLDWLKRCGYSNLHSMDLDLDAWLDLCSQAPLDLNDGLAPLPWPHGRMDAILLDEVLEHFSDPVGLLEGLRSRLVVGGRIYLTMPNLDSYWIGQYGPSWHPWNFPYRQFITGTKGLREIARRARYSVVWISTATPIQWIYLSDMLGRFGLDGHVAPHATRLLFDAKLWRRAGGAVLHSRFFYDRRLKGDCLFACLSKV